MPELPQIAPGNGFAPVSIAKPSIAEAGRGAQELGRAADEVMDQAAQLGAHFAEMRRLNQANLAQAEYASGAEDAITGPQGVLNDPNLRSNPDLARVAAQKRLDALTSQIVQKYPTVQNNAMVIKNLAIHQQGVLRTVWLHAHGNAEQDTKDETEAAGAAALNNALTLSDPKERQRAVTDYYQLLDAHTNEGLFTKGEADLMKSKFGAAVAKGQLQQLALQRPEQVLMMATPPPDVPPQDLKAIRDMARDQIEQPWRNAGAQIKAQQGAAEQKMLSDAAAGNLNRNELEQLRAHGLVSEATYEMFTGRPYKANLPSAPGLRDAYTHAIDSALTPDELDSVELQVKGASREDLSATDAAYLLMRGSKRSGELKRTESAQEAQAWLQLQGQLDPTGSMMYKLHFGHAIDLKDYFAAQVKINKGNVPKAVEATEQHFRDYLKHPDNKMAVGSALDAFDR